MKTQVNKTNNLATAYKCILNQQIWHIDSDTADLDNLKTKKLPMLPKINIKTMSIAAINLILEEIKTRWDYL